MTLDIYNGIWKKMILGTMDPPIKSLPLKIKINFLKMQVNTHKIDADSASRELADYCLQNEKMLASDLDSLKKANSFLI